MATPGYPVVFIKATIGMMKAKLEPMYAGICFFVIKMWSKVPTPELNKAIPGFKPTNNGTKTVDPNIENMCCNDNPIHCKNPGFSLTSSTTSRFISMSKLLFNSRLYTKNSQDDYVIPAVKNLLTYGCTLTRTCQSRWADLKTSFLNFT